MVIHLHLVSSMRLGLRATVQEAPSLLALARAAVGGDVVVDCEDTEQCDAAGLQVLLALRAEVQRTGHAFRVRNVRESLRWRFDAVGLSTREVSA